MVIRVRGKTQQLVWPIKVQSSPDLTAYAAVFGGAARTGPAQLQAWGFPAGQLKTLQIPSDWSVSDPPEMPPSSWLTIPLPETADSTEEPVQSSDYVTWDPGFVTLQARMSAKCSRQAAARGWLLV